MQSPATSSAARPRRAGAHPPARMRVAAIVTFRAAHLRRGFKGFNIFAIPPLGGDVAKSRRYGLLA